MAENGDRTRDEEFYYLLTEGSEHLQAGRIEDARGHFERALAIYPTNEQATNLLGLSLFRLGHLDRARQIFADLVHNNPIEPSLRLNLSMVYLKMGKIDDAHMELERVLELNPDHPRATSYMGLVLEKKGQLERAAEYYERAGNKKRAEEIRAFRPSQTGTFPMPNLKAMGVSTPPMPAPTMPPIPAPAPAPPALPPAPVAASMPPAPASMPPAPPPLPRGSEPPRHTSQAEAAALTAATAAQLKKGGEVPTPQAMETARGASLGFTFDVDEKKRSDRDAPGDLAVAELAGRAVAPDGGLRRTEQGLLLFPVVEVAYARTDLLAGFTGSFELEVVHRRYRGKRTDSLFGGTDAALVALSGRGMAVLHVTPSDLSITSLSLANDELYLLESSVVAFSAGLVWENGRLPSDSDKDLDIVHLRGSGRVLLGTKRPAFVLQVRSEQPVTVQASRLVGWTGQLVPYRGPLPGLPDNARRIPIVRFEGNGLVLSS